LAKDKQHGSLILRYIASQIQADIVDFIVDA